MLKHKKVLKCVSKLNLCVQDVSHFSSPLIIKAVCRNHDDHSQSDKQIIFYRRVSRPTWSSPSRISESNTKTSDGPVSRCEDLVQCVMWCVFDRSQDLRPIWAISCSYTVHAIAAIMVLLRERGTAPRKKPTNPWSWQTDRETGQQCYLSIFLSVFILIFWF